MTKEYSLIIFISFLLGACGESKPPESQFNVEKQEDIVEQITSLDSIEKAALSFHKWNVESILNETESIAYDFEIIESANGKCKLDSAGYFKNLRKLGTISEEFIRLEWQRVEECSSFLENLDWEEYTSADAYEYQDFCNIYFHYWTRSQEPFHGVEVRNVEKVDDRYLVTLVFYYNYDVKDYSESFLPLVNVEKENGNWKITEINWLEK